MTTWTTTADFASWFKLNVSAAIVADQLQLLPATSPGPMPVLRAMVTNIAHASPMGSVGELVCLDTDTGALLGRYRTLPTNGTTGSNTVFSIPENVFVDLYGNAWITDAVACTPPSTSVVGGTVTKIGLVIGGTRCDSSGAVNANGLYLKPPFTYNSGVVDRDSDGLLRTFNPASETTSLAWVNATDLAGGADARTVDNVDDFVRVLQRITGANTYALASQPSDESVWVGTYRSPFAHEVNRVDNYTGQILETVSPALFSTGRGGWQARIDGANVLWMTDRVGFIVRYPLPSGPAALITPSNMSGVGGNLGHTPLCVDRDGNIWIAQVANPTGTINFGVWKFDSAGNQIVGFPKQVNSNGAAGVSFTGMCCRYQDNSIWVTYGATLYRLDSSGNITGSLVAAAGHTYQAIDVDSNGKVWVIDAKTSAPVSASAVRVDPATNLIDLGPITLHATPLGENTDNSGMTGNARLGSSIPQGFADKVYDNGVVTSSWTVSWHETIPAGCSLVVEYRVALTELGLAPIAWSTATNGLLFASSGQFIELRVTFRSDAFGSSATPVLLDITIDTAPLPTELRLGQSLIEFLYTRISGIGFVPVPELRLGQSMIEYLYSTSNEIRYGQGMIEFLYSEIDQGPADVGCGTGLVSYFGADQGCVSGGVVAVAGAGVVSSYSGDAGVVSCFRSGAGVVSFFGADQGNLQCP